jgi:hypothetical protein
VTGVSEDEHLDNSEFTLHDRAGAPLRFKGQLLSDMRWGSGPKPRWTDMALYAVSSMAHDRTLRVAVECEGCTPRRTLMIEQRSLDEGDILCGRCGKLFIPSETQRDEQVRYALQITARSRMYHAVNSPCVRSKHRKRTIASLKGDPERLRMLSPCPETGCRPPPLDRMGPQERIAEERDDPQLYLCVSAADVISKLYRRNGEITVLAAKLLREAAIKDPDIALAMISRTRV